MGNDSWMYQGRQAHGRFGDGTKGEDSAGGDGGLFGRNGLSDRIGAVAHGATASLPPASRSRPAARFAGEALSRLTEAMTAWAGGETLDQVSFADRFFDRAADDPVVARLRGAARGAAQAKSHADLREAADDLAGAMQTIGLDRWPRFLAEVQDRAGQAAANAPTRAAPPEPQMTDGLVNRTETFPTQAANAEKKAASGGVTVVLPNGQHVPDSESPTGFLMSPVPNLDPVAAAGRQTGQQYRELLDEPEAAAGVFPQLFISLLTHLGHGGTFDYQRDGNHVTGFTQLPQFRNVSNVNVGLFGQQAGLSLEETLLVAGAYATVFSSNARPERSSHLDERTEKFIGIGYDLGRSGQFGNASGQ